MTNHEKTLSTQLDQAREMEAHYRALLLFWKQRRQWLESQIPGNSVFDQILSIAQKAWSKDGRPN
jgi:hypothetical protein